MKSLLLATACFYMAHPNLPPQVAEHMVPEVLKQAYAMQPGTRKEIIITQDNLCYKIALEPIDASALGASSIHAANCGVASPERMRKSRTKTPLGCW